MAFESLVYTDARSEESIHGTDGFQFQAISDGVTSADEDFARHLLYIPPTVLMMGSDVSVEDFPESCAYLSSANGHFLARGRYLGRVGDGRRGNQVTHCLKTAFDSDILPSRPAQLYSAPDWSLKKSPDVKLAQLPAPLRVRPEFEPPALRAMVVADERASRTLPHFLTMVDEAVSATGTRLVIVHPDLDTIMRWIALGTLFLDPETALGAGFRVFSSTPLSDGLFPFVGTCDRVLSEPLGVDSAVGVNVIDLESFEHSRIAVTGTAATHAAWFLQSDAFSAIDAVVVSRRWTALVGEDAANRAVARVIVEAEGLDGLPTAAATVLAALAQDAAADDLEEYGDALADAAVEARDGVSGEILPVVKAAWALHDFGAEPLAGRLFVSALERAVASAPEAASWCGYVAEAPPGRRPVTWPDDETRRRAVALLAILMDASSARDLPSVFTLARELNTGITTEAIGGALTRLAGAWAADPGLYSRWRGWLHRDAVLDALPSAVAERLAGPEGDACAAQLRSGVWDWLMGPDWQFVRGEPLAAWLAGRRVALADPGVRGGLVTSYAAGVSAHEWPAFFDPNAEAVDPDLLRRWIVVHEELSPDFARLVERTLSVGLSTGRARALTPLLDVLSDPRVGGLSAGLHRLASEHGRFTRALGSALANLDGPNADHVAVLAESDARLVLVHADLVADLVLECREPVEVAAWAAASDHDWGSLVSRRVGALLAHDPRGVFGRGIAVWACPLWPSTVRDAVAKVMTRWWKDVADVEIKTDIASDLSADERTTFEEMYRANSSGFRAKRNPGQGRRAPRRGSGT